MALFLQLAVFPGGAMGWSVIVGFPDHMRVYLNQF